MRTVVTLAWIALLVAIWAQWFVPDYGAAKIDASEPPQWCGGSAGRRGVSGTDDFDIPTEEDDQP